jgi:hypothetical protein
LFGRNIDLADVCNHFCYSLQNFHTKLGVTHFASTKHDRDFDFVTFDQKLLDLTGLGIKVTDADLWSVLHFFDGGVGRLFASLFGALTHFVFESIEIHHLAHRWYGVWCNLDQIQIGLACDV